MSVDAIEHIFLADGKHCWLNGNDDISFADLWCAAELEQPMMAGFKITDEHKLLGEHHARVRARMNPNYDEATKVHRRCNSELI